MRRDLACARRLLLAWVLLGLARPGWSGGPELPKGLDELSIGGGPGLSHVVNDSFPDGDFLAATVAWWHFVADRHALGVEGVPMFLESQGNRVYGYGFTLVGRHYVIPMGRDAVFLEWGAGLLHFDEEVPPETVKTDFNLRLGAGLRHALDRSKAIAVGYRFNHISNGGRADWNPGVNASFPFVELSIAF